MGRIATCGLILAVYAAPVVAKADGWRVELPERKGSPKIAKTAPSRPQAGPIKVALPAPAITHNKRAVADDQDEASVQPVAKPARGPRRVTAAEDPDIPIAREAVVPRAPRYGPERLRADYRAPSRVTAPAYSLPPVLPTRATTQPAAVKPVASIYARLHDLQGMALMSELDQIGHEIMQRNPVGTPVSQLRAEYRELVRFVSERTGIPSEHIYRVMDLESHGGQYWAENASSGASGLVQVRPIALEELQRLRPDEFIYVDFVDIQRNPALNLYVGMSYAEEKGQDWDRYSGRAAGYADYVLNGKPGA